MSATIEQLEVQVQSNATSAVSGIDALASSLGKLKTALHGGVGLTAVTRQLTTLNTALDSLNSANFSKFGELANALAPLSSLGTSNLSGFVNQLQKLPQAVQALGSVNMGSMGAQITQLASALTPLTEVGKSNLGSFVTQLKKLPEAMTALNSVDMGALTRKIQELANALAPLATQLQAVSSGFSNLPTKVKQLSNNLNKFDTSNEKASKSTSGLGSKITAFAAKITVGVMAVKRVMGVIAGWITKSNEYVENLNLFTVSMGEFADEAQKYAESVGEIMGIDPGEWMRNQGIFMTLATGFGVISDRAYTMSQNLTQLGYDLSSFFNISYEDAFQKLQSGIAGELEPLRRLGYDLSVARLQQEAYTLGIKKKVTEMTQAEKAELRYYAILTQVNSAQGDMARTLEAPANQLRVLKSQVTQCARALGNIFIPALNAVLPYAIALVKALRFVADAIANLFGFALPDIDYSGLSNTASSADDVATGLGGAANKAKELKNALLGIDELNVISPPEDSGGGGGGGGVGGNGLDFELPTYDFLGDAISTRVDEIFGKLKARFEEIAKKAKEIGVVDAFIKLKEAISDAANSKGMVKLKEILDFLDDNVITSALTLIRDLLKFIADILNGDLKSGINDFKNILADITFDPLVGVAGIIDIICGTDLAGWLSDVKKELVNFDFTKLNGFEALSDGIEDLKQGFAKLKEGLKKLGDALRESGVADTIKDFIGWLVKTKVDVILFDIGTALGIIGDVLSIIGSIFSGDFGGVVNGIKDFLTTFTFAPFERFSQVIDSITGFDVAGVVRDIVNAIKEFDLAQWFVDIGVAMWEGIKKGWNEAIHGIKEFVNGLVQRFKDALGIHSPSTVFAGIGKDIVAGLLQGINGFTSMANTVKEWSAKVIEWFTKGKDGENIVDHFKGIGGDIIEGFKGKINNSYVNVKSSITTWASRVKEWFTSSSYGGVNATSFGTYASNVLKGFKDKISNTYTSVKDSVTTWASKVKDWFKETVSYDKFASYASEIINGFKNRIGSSYTDVKNNMQTFATSVKSWFTEKVSYETFRKVASDVIEGFKKGIGDLYKTCKQTITDWGGDILTWFKEKLKIKSPSRAFYELAGYTVEGFNNGFTALGKTTKGVVNDWANSITTVTPTMGFAVDTSALKYYNSDSFGRSVSANVTSNASVTATGFVEGMEEFYRDYIQPTMTQMAADMRRQADKPEQTIVQIGNRTVSDAVATQQRANGYVFAR